MLKKNPDLNLANSLALLTRTFFGIYWIYDNLNILSKLKIFEKDPKSFAKTGALFWLFALLTSLISVVREIILNEKKIEHIKRYTICSFRNILALSNEKEINDKRSECHAAEKKRVTLGLNLVKILGDIIPAGQGS